MATVIETLVSKLGWQYDDKGIKQHDRDVKQSTATLAQSEKQGASWGKRLASAGKAVAAGLAVAATAAAAAGVAVARFGLDAAKEFANVGDEVAKTSAKLGVTTDELQRLRFAAGRSGASSESLSVAIKTLNRQLLDASKTGKGPLVDALGEIGLSLEDLEGKTTEQRFGVLADRIQAIEDPARKSALAMKLFGEQGTALVPALNEGSAGLAKLYAIAEQQPGFFSREQLAEAERLNDALGDLQGSVAGAKQQIGAALAPAVSEIVEFVTQWIRENQKFIRQDLPALFKGVASGAKVLVEQLAFAVEQWQFLTQEAFRFGQWAEETWPGISDAMRSAFEALANPIESIADLVGRVTDRIDTLAESLGIIQSRAQGLSALLGLQEEKTTPIRGAPGFAGETEQKRIERFSTYSPAQLARFIVDPNVAEVDKDAAARAMAKSGKRTAEANAVTNLIVAGASQLDRLRSVGAVLPVQPAARRRGGGGRAGGASSTAPEEVGPTIDELINGLGEGGASMRDVLDSARMGLPTGRQTPLQGAQIVRVDASYNATTNVTVELPLQAVREGAQVAAGKAAEMIRGMLDERDRQAFQHYQAAVSI